MPRKKSTSKPETPLEQLSSIEPEAPSSIEQDTGNGVSQPDETTGEETSAQQAGDEFSEQLLEAEEIETKMTDWPETEPQKPSEDFDSPKENPTPDILHEEAGLTDEFALHLTQQTVDNPLAEDSVWEETEPDSLLNDEDALQAEPLQVSEDLSSGLQKYLPAEQNDISDTAQVSKFGHPEEKASETATPAPRSKSAREEFFAINIKMDRKLSSKQQEEWENIYTSFRSRSALHGIISGKEIISLKVFNEATGSNEIKDILCLTVVQYRIKVLIPETELLADGQAHPRHIVSHMIGAQIDYVITNIDKAGGCAIASRRKALELRRNRFKFARRGNQSGNRILVNVLVVGPKLMRVECWGHDMLLTPRDLSYASVADLREEYHSGQQLEAVIKEYDAENDKLKISVKEANPNPFDDADIRHPVGSESRHHRRKISGRCTLQASG